MTKANVTLAIQWIIYFPIVLLILPWCVILGAAQGIITILLKICHVISADVGIVHMTGKTDDKYELTEHVE